MDGLQYGNAVRKTETKGQTNMKTLDEAIQQIFRPHIIFAKESEAGLEGEEVVKRQLYWGGELVRNRVVMEAMLPMAVELFVAQMNAGMGVEDVVNNIGITMLSYGVAIGVEMEKGELTDGRPPVSNRANPMAQHPPFQAMVRKIVDQARVLVEEVASPLDSEWAYEDFKAAVMEIMGDYQDIITPHVPLIVHPSPSQICRRNSD